MDAKRLAEILRAADSGDKAGLVQALLQQFVDEGPGSWRDELALYIATLATRHGTVNGTYSGLRETLEGEKRAVHRVPSPRNVSRAFKRYGRREPHERDLDVDAQTTKRPLDYDPDALDHDADQVFDAAIRAARELGALRDRGFYVAHDGTHHPFYGDSYDYGENARPVDPAKLSIAGTYATAGFRNHGANRSFPLYPGTKNKHDYFQLNLHVYDSNESLPLRIRRTGANPNSLNAMIDAVDALAVKPLFWFADKEFATERYLRRLLPWCNQNRIVLITPVPKTPTIRQLVVDHWHDGTAKPAHAHGDVLYWWAQPYRFNMNSRGRDQPPSPPFRLLTLYYEGNKGEDDAHREEVVISLGENLYAVCFLLNVEVTQENVVWLAAQYGLRWATENLFKRAKAYTGTSFSSGMFGRHLAYVSAMAALSGYALWRMERRLHLGLEANNPLLSHVRFFDDLRYQCVQRLFGNPPPVPVLEAPPSPFTLPQKQRRLVGIQPQTEAAVASYA